MERQKLEYKKLEFKARRAVVLWYNYEVTEINLERVRENIVIVGAITKKGQVFL